MKITGLPSYNELLSKKQTTIKKKNPVVTVIRNVDPGYTKCPAKC